MLEKLGDAIMAFRYVLSEDAIVCNVTIEGKIDATGVERALIKPTAIKPAPRGSRSQPGGDKEAREA